MCGRNLLVVDLQYLVSHFITVYIEIITVIKLGEEREEARETLTVATIRLM